MLRRGLFTAFSFECVVLYAWCCASNGVFLTPSTVPAILACVLSRSILCVTLVMPTFAQHLKNNAVLDSNLLRLILRLRVSIHRVCLRGCREQFSTALRAYLVCQTATGITPYQVMASRPWGKCCASWMTHRSSVRLRPRYVQAPAGWAYVPGAGGPTSV